MRNTSKEYLRPNDYGILFDHAMTTDSRQSPTMEIHYQLSDGRLYCTEWNNN